MHGLSISFPCWTVTLVTFVMLVATRAQAQGPCACLPAVDIAVQQQDPNLIWNVDFDAFPTVAPICLPQENCLFAVPAGECEFDVDITVVRLVPGGQNPGVLWLERVNRIYTGPNEVACVRQGPDIFDPNAPFQTADFSVSQSCGSEVGYEIYFAPPVGSQVMPTPPATAFTLLNVSLICNQCGVE